MKVNNIHNKRSTNISAGQLIMGRFHNLFYLTADYISSRIFPGIIEGEKKFNITRRSPYRGKGDPPVAHPHLNERCDDPGEDRNMNYSLPDHTFFMLVLFRFKLRFYENYSLGTGKEIPYLSVYLQNRYKREIGAYKIYPVTEIRAIEAPCIPSLHDNNTVVISQTIVQLAITHINGVDDLCPRLKYAVGKSPRGSPEINGIFILQGDIELLQSLLKL